MAKMSNNSNKKVVSLPKSANKAISDVKNKVANMKPASKTPSPSQAMKDLADSITQRYRVTAREARDIVTAVGTKISSSSGANINKKSTFKGGVDTTPTAGSNLKKQVKETITAAKTGKAGTSSDKISGATNASNVKKGISDPTYKYVRGKQR